MLQRVGERERTLLCLFFWSIPLYGVCTPGGWFSECIPSRVLSSWEMCPARCCWKHNPRSECSVLQHPRSSVVVWADGLSGAAAGAAGVLLGVRGGEGITSC